MTENASRRDRYEPGAHGAPSTAFRDVGQCNTSGEIVNASVPVDYRQAHRSPSPKPIRIIRRLSSAMRAASRTAPQRAL